MGISTVGWLLLRLFRLRARTSRPLGVPGRERLPPMLSLLTRWMGPFLLLLLFRPLLLRGKELVRGLLGLDWGTFTEAGGVSSWMGSKLVRMGDPKRAGWSRLTTVTPAADACNENKSCLQSLQIHNLWNFLFYQLFQSLSCVTWQMCVVSSSMRGRAARIGASRSSGFPYFIRSWTNIEIEMDSVFWFGIAMAWFKSLAWINLLGVYGLLEVS